MVKQTLLSIVALHLLSIAPAGAASQGSLDPISYGSFNVELEVPAKVRISNLANLDMGIFGGQGTGDMSIDRDVCIYTNTPAGRYRITATGSGAGGTFTMETGGSNIPYQAYWNDTIGTTGREYLTPSVALSNQTGANQSSEDCSVGGNSANVSINVHEPDILYKPNGIYTGTLTLMVEPE